MVSQLPGTIVSVTLLVVCVNIGHVTSAEPKQLIFRLIDEPTKGPVRLGKGWYEPTAGACAATCIMKYDNCRCFMHNASTRLCTPGSWISENHPPPSIAEGSLFHSFSCDESKGFRLITYKNTTACVGKFTPPLNYAEANQACKIMGSFLASVKTVDKLMLLRSIFDNEEVWVGCDEIVQDNRFVWKEDGEILPLRSPLFAEWQPDNKDGDEECVAIQRPSYYLGDWMCYLSFNYVCEISVP